MSSEKSGAAGFAGSAATMFLALRAGDAVNVAAGLWFVPKYVSPGEIGAVLPVASFATFLSLPVFAFAMAVMKEASWLAAAGRRAEVKSLLCGVFAAAAALSAAVAAVAAVLAPAFLSAMRVDDLSAGFLAGAAAFLGCLAPVYTDALQSLKRFRALAAAEVCGAAVRFLVMAVAMPFRALAGFFAGQAALPVYRIAASVFALRKDLAAPGAEGYWSRETRARLAKGFLAVLAYQAAPMAAALAEQSILRTSLSAADSAGYYMASRFADFLQYLTFPLLLAMFPYTASAAGRDEPVRPYVLKCSAVALAAGGLMAAAYSLCGAELMALAPNGAAYAEYARYMPWLAASGALTACQVFHTNAEVSAGRAGFLKWLVPLHAAYPLALWAAVEAGAVASLSGLVACFCAASAARFAFAAAGTARAR